MRLPAESGSEVDGGGCLSNAALLIGHSEDSSGGREGQLLRGKGPAPTRDVGQLAREGCRLVIATAGSSSLPTGSTLLGRRRVRLDYIRGLGVWVCFGVWVCCGVGLFSCAGVCFGVESVSASESVSVSTASRRSPLRPWPSGWGVRSLTELRAVQLPAVQLRPLGLAAQFVRADRNKLKSSRVGRRLSKSAADASSGADPPSRSGSSVTCLPWMVSFWPECFT